MPVSPVSLYPMGMAMGQDHVYPILLGRDIYNAKTRTGLARSAVEDHVNFTLAGVDLEADYDIEPETVAEARIVDGSIVVADPPGYSSKEPTLLPDIYCPNKNTIHQYVREADGSLTLECPGENLEYVYSTPEFRVWTSNGKNWSETIYDRHAGTVEEKKGRTVPLGAMITYPNGRGLLFFVQDLWHSMEHLEQTEEWVMSGPNLLPIITNYNGSQGQLENAWRGAKHVIALPGRSEVDRVVSNTVVSQMLQKSDQQQARILAAYNAVEQDTPDRPVASDREKRMQAMKLYIRKVRQTVSKVMALWGETMTYDQIVVQSPTDRRAEADLIMLINPQNREKKLLELLP